MASAARGDGGPASPPRNVWVEGLRIVAAFGIVWYHSRYLPGRFVGYGGLIFFVVVAAFYETRRTRSVSVGVTAGRLLIPWAVWSLAFAAVNIAQRDPIFTEGGPLAGTAPHLWYLPFIFAVTVAIRFMKGRVAYPALFGLGLMLVTAAAWRQATVYAGPPVSQWVHALPAAMLGIVLAQPGPRWTLMAGMAIGAMLLLLSITGVGLPYTVGCGAAAFALTSPSSTAPTPMLDRLAPLMFGVYLVHPLFLSAAHRLGLLNVPQIVAAFVASAVAVAAIRRTTLGRAIT